MSGSKNNNFDYKLENKNFTNDYEKEVDANN